MLQYMRHHDKIDRHSLGIRVLSVTLHRYSQCGERSVPSLVRFDRLVIRSGMSSNPVPGEISTACTNLPNGSHSDAAGPDVTLDMSTPQQIDGRVVCDREP